MKIPVELTIDNEMPDLAYVTLTPTTIDRYGIVKETKSIEMGKATVNLDFDQEGKVVGIELIGFQFHRE